MLWEVAREVYDGLSFKGDLLDEFIVSLLAKGASDKTIKDHFKAADALGLGRHSLVPEGKFWGVLRKIIGNFFSASESQ